MSSPTSRVGLRFLHSTSRPHLSNKTRTHLSRRWQATEATASPLQPQAQAQSPFQRFYNSPIGPKTVHFWAPVMKWGLVLAGVADFARPAEKLSLTQNVALMGTGAIWTRWCLIIKPRNVLLASVNFLLGCVGLVQVTRVLLYQRGLEGAGDTSDLVVGKVEEVKDGIVGAVKDGEEKIKAAVK